MSEYEMASLLNDTGVAVLAQTQFYFAMLTAFLVVSYVVAHRLTRSMATVVVGLFFSLGCTFNIYRLSRVAGGLMGKMHTVAASGKGLEWHPAKDVSEWALVIIGVPGAAVFVLATVAAIYFFFHSRRVNRKAEAAEAPKP
jgi:hypothetical protein